MNKYVYSYNDLCESISYSSGIKQKHVEKTLNHIYENIKELLRISDNDIVRLGSAGYKINPDDISHNLNIGVNRQAIVKNNKNVSPEYALSFFQDQLKRLGLETQLLAEQGKLIVNWYINGLKRLGIVEVQFKLTNNLDWLRWSRIDDYCTETNKYSAKHRELLYEVIIDALTPQIIEYFDDKHNVRTFNKYVFESENGLNIETYTFMGKNGMLKKPMPVYGSKKIITQNPQKVIEMLFGKNISHKNLTTFESVYEILMSDSFQFKKKRPKILSTYQKKLSGHNLEIPDVLNKKI